MGEGAERLEQKEDFPEAREKIENVKKNLLEYFDSDHIKKLFENTKTGSKSIEKKKEYIKKTENGNNESRTEKKFSHMGKKFIKLEKNGEVWCSESVERKQDYVEISEERYNRFLEEANGSNINDVKKFLSEIDKMVIIKPSSERKDAHPGSNGKYNILDNKIYVPDDASEFTLAHEILHALQENFQRIGDLLIINKKKIKETSRKIRSEHIRLYEKELQQEKNLAEQELKIAIKKQKKLKNNQRNLNSIDYEVELYEIETEIEYQKNILEILDSKLEDRDAFFDDDEFHARLFDLRYACKYYLGVKLGDPISIDNINDLMENEEYLKENEFTYHIPETIIFINGEIAEEKNIDRRIELEQIKSEIFKEVLDLINNDLVFNDQGNQGDLVPKSI